MEETVKLWYKSPEYSLSFSFGETGKINAIQMKRVDVKSANKWAET